ncbi:MAG: nucleotidyltransferase family protein [Bacteroidales bacterium]|nr:nucleotidyltransferase family protein [Bacteroidales bacterium]
MDKIQKNTFLLLRTALFHEPVTVDVLSEREWFLVYENSVKQGVAAFCFDAVRNLPQSLRPNREVFLQWALYTEKTEKQYNEKKVALSVFVDMVKDESIRPLILKGFSLSRLYPVRNHRHCGDIDIYCFDKSHRVDNILENNGVEVEHENPRHSVFYINDVLFENHHFFLYNKSDADEQKLERFLQNEAAKSLSLSDSSVLTGTPMGNAVFFLKHSEMDFVHNRMNIRLRTLCDWAMLLNSGQLDYYRLKEVVAGSSISRFADVLTTVSVRLLGLPSEYLNFFTPVDTKVVDDFITLILNYQDQIRYRGTVRGRMQRFAKYVRHYSTYKYLFGKNIIKWHYFSK